MINQIYTFDDIVNSEIQNELQTYVHNENLQWEDVGNITGVEYSHEEYSFPAKVLISETIDENILKLINIIIDNSLLKINKKLLKKYRVKINKTIPHIFDLKEEYRLLHIDKPERHVTIIYYINDCDGDTLIFNDKNNKHLHVIGQGKTKDDGIDFENFELTKSVSPKKGRVVMFDGTLWHYGKYPTTGERNIININLVIEEHGNKLI
jgi:hypothetical protein